MFSSLLIANRGEIACRIIRTARAMGLRTVAVYSDADKEALHVQMADEAFRIGPAPAAQSYLKGDAIIEAALEAGTEAIHPGYGFLSENAAFAQKVANAGLIFVGPPPEAIRAMGLKDGAKRLMEEAGVPVVPGYHGDDQTADGLAKEAARIGYPVLIKAVAGGGGKGMRRVNDADGFAAALEGAKREAANAFGDERVLIEKYIVSPRHIEMQVFADAHGNAVHLYERDCSLQRRHQKVVEEAPAPGMPKKMRAAMGEAAVAAAKAIGYRGAGTIEFIAGTGKGHKPDGFYFMEMNTRLQVEHPVTEMVTGIDLVEWQLRVAAGEKLPLSQDEIPLSGHAVEVRLYAENPQKDFLPSTGVLHRLRLSGDEGFVRIDTGVREEDEVTPFYDPMIAKIIAHGQTRDEALRRLERALRESEIAGPATNAAFLARAVAHPDFVAGAIDTGFIERHAKDLIPPGGDPPAEIKLLAALARIALREEGAFDASLTSGDPFSPWHEVDGFRLNAPRDEALRFGKDTPFEIAVRHLGGGRCALTLDGQTAEGSADLDEDGTLEADIGGRRLRAGAIMRGNTLLLMHDGAAHTVPLADAFEAEGLDEGRAATIAAPMPGKVVSVHAEPGKAVRRGEALVVLEAMKMEHTLTAGSDAKIDSVRVAAGDQVEEGAVLVTFAAE